MSGISSLVLSLAASFARLLPDSVKQAVYRSGPLARMIRRGLNRAAPRGITPVTVAAGGLAGMRLSLDLQTEKDYWLGTYEPELQRAILELVRPGDVVYDVGANIGYISLLLAKAVGGTGRVYAFEALPANVERLRTNLVLNEENSRVIVVPAAVVERSRLVRFLVGPSGGMGKADGSAGRQEIPYKETIEVPGIALDEFVYDQGHPSPQVIKMDIEGGEVLAIPGMPRLLAEGQPLILLELHGPEAGRLIWTALVNAGYQICHMAPGFPGVQSMEVLDWKAYLVAMPPA
jgi:FkbM family methyltransferase